MKFVTEWVIDHDTGNVTDEQRQGHGEEQEQGQGQIERTASIELELHSDGNETNAGVTTLTMTESELVGYGNTHSGKGTGKGNEKENGKELGTVLEHGLCFKSDTQKSKGYFWKIFLLSFAFSFTNSMIVFLVPCYLPSFVESICD